MLKAGDKAPGFSGLTTDGTLLGMKDFKGRKLIVFFYPKDNTPGCTAEACNLRDNYSGLKKAGYELVGVSIDPVTSHQKFTEKFSLPFPLIADTDKKIVQQFGVWGEKSLYGKKYMGTLRTTFIINEKGVIAHIIDKVKTNDHTSQILSLT